ncbi:MAG: hypothetical protein ACKOZY_06095 [Flavobacteriales bacterium]
MGLLVCSIFYWANMIWDDWCFVEHYGVDLQSFGLWMRFYLVYCVLGWTMIYWPSALVARKIRARWFDRAD